MGSKTKAASVTASTLVLAALRERVAALHAAVEFETDEPVPTLDDTEVAASSDGAPDTDAGQDDDGGTSVTVPAAPEEVPDADASDDEDDDSVVAAGVDVEGLAEVLAELDAVVAGFAPLIEGPDVTPLRAELAWARAIVDEARGLEDTVDVLEDLLGGLDPSLRLGPVEQRLRLVVSARTTERRDAVATMLTQPEWSSLVEHADRLVLTAPIAGSKPKHTAKVLASALTAADEAARQAADAAVAEARGSDRAGDPQLAPVISAATTVATTAHVTQPVLGKDARKLARAAEALAAALVERRRSEAAAHWLVDLADLAHRAGEPSFTYGVLHVGARTRRELADDALEAAVTAYTKPKLHKL
ncbi:CHAD domain-containing protein [Actinomycetospora chiangmaiensis]|uniref:CHAD domain-containing protein n=1 Tax=Actinomycetospora chiangmaiensis TaxID=402650 RepID=UPI0004779162|nr:CHAD domain-containing protein [Actinomycetospora chiangmaiensis]